MKKTTFRWYILGALFLICLAIFAGPILWARYSPWREKAVIEPITESEIAPVEDYRSPPELTILEIPALEISAKIIAPPEDLSGSVNDWVESNLDEGVVVYPAGVTKITQSNLTLFGHSSALNWRAPYVTIFATLDRLKIDDEIYLRFKDDSVLRYRVNEKPATISTKRVEIVRADAGAGRLTLVTCWPPGTTLNRLIVRAELVR